MIVTTQKIRPNDNDNFTDWKVVGELQSHKQVMIRFVCVILRFYHSLGPGRVVRFSNYYLVNPINNSNTKYETQRSEMVYTEVLECRLVYISSVGFK